MFQTFSGGVIQPGQVSYLALALSGNAQLAWPSFAAVGQNVTALVIEVTPSAPSLAIAMPDATQAGVGSTMLIRNLGASTFTLTDVNGNTIGTVASGVSVFLYLQDNATSSGVWRNITFGTGTSSADSATLAGMGLQAIGITLNQSHPAIQSAGTITISSVSLAQNYVATGGSVACNLPTSASAGDKFFFLLKNAGTGTVTLTPSGADTVDSAATVALAPNDACFVLSLGAANGWVTIGLGRSVNFAFTQLVKSVAGAANVTLSSAECQNKVHTYTGILTGNINVIVTNTVSVYYIFNNTTGAFSLTVKTAAGSGITVTQGSHAVLVCDATNVYTAVSNISGTTLFSAGSAANPSVTFVANVTTGLYIPSANVLGISANGFEVMSFNGPAASVNWIDSFASATGVAVRLTANGTDANLDFAIRARGTGSVVIQDPVDATKQGAFVASSITTATKRSYTLPDASGVIVLDTMAQTLTNKTIGNTNTVSLKDSLFSLQDDGDATKLLAFQLSGITTGNTRTITMADGNLAFAAVTAKGDIWAASASGVFARVAVGADGTTLTADSSQASGVTWGASFSTGDGKITLKSVADTGWVMCNDGTIGSATSGATTRANADTVNLFTLIWNNVSNTWAAVSGGRGANAAADFAANKTIALTKNLGRAIAISGSGVGLTARALGETLGEETHVLSVAEMPSHAGHVTGQFTDAQPGSGANGTVSTTSTGGGGAHQNMQPSSFWNMMIKL